MKLPQYIETISKRYKSGISSEHSYRADLENLIRELVHGVAITNEPSKVTDCGNPDYVITKRLIPIGFIEAKDIGKDLNSKQYKEQFSRYKKALDNLIITDYLWFQFFQNGELVHEIRIGEIEGSTIESVAKNFDEFENLIKNFCTFVGQTIKSSKKLAGMMAAKARLLQVILDKAVSSDEETQENSTLKEQYESFKKILIHDLKPKEFADIYAQTLAYGMFAARLHDTSLDDFSRQEAAELIPKTNPFLRKLFQYVAGYDIDERIRTTVDNLAEVFRATNVEALLKNLGKSIKTHDPIIHFYETFLTEYDPRLRKARGVWYTPEPVVNFIVRAVDDLLKSEFGLKEGLADTSKTMIKVKAQGTVVTKGRNKGKAIFVDKEVHKVQILDPAAGTGTFLSEVIKYIYSNKFEAMQGAWSAYVEEHLIPRLNGFEILMASYSMAHLKLDMLLSETGYKPKKEQRFNIYLTNSLEEHHPDTGTLFSTWLSSEANEANYIKRDTPVMVVMGNPPYSGESANKGEWIMGLMEDYKKEPGGKNKLKEKNTKWINDDYVKFIRYGQHFIEQNGEGILAFINPHGFLDNPTFRGMRWHILKTFDKIYTIDLHGNANKKEICPDGSPDKNVFDILQGVSINLFVKTGGGKKGELAQVKLFDLYGSREAKYQYLWNQHLGNIEFTDLSMQKPQYFFSNKDFSLSKKYNKFFSLSDLFVISGNGIVTKRDKLCIQSTRKASIQSANDIINLDKAEFYAKYQLPKDVRDWRYDWAMRDIKINFDENSSIAKINYRPFDVRYIVYTGKARGFVGWPVDKVMRNYLCGDNIGLLVSRMTKGLPFAHCFVTSYITEAIFLSSITSTNAFNHPLYIYPKNGGLFKCFKDREPNFDPAIVEKISKLVNLEYEWEKSDSAEKFSPIDIFDYVYAVLNCPTYREKYKEFLYVDFPKIPYPKDKNTFWQLVKLGAEIRQIHLLETEKAEGYIASYPEGGDDVITRKLNKKDWELYDSENKLGRIRINGTQYFDRIPLLAWEFYIGGYQPAQKWLKDRRGRKLSYEDILHYQKIIVALTETDRVMKEIDKIYFE